MPTEISVELEKLIQNLERQWNNKAIWKQRTSWGNLTEP